MTHAERDAAVLEYMKGNAGRLDSGDYGRIAGQYGWGRTSTFDTLSRLVDRGLVVSDGTGRGRLPFVLTAAALNRTQSPLALDDHGTPAVSQEHGPADA